MLPISHGLEMITLWEVKNALPFTQIPSWTNFWNNIYKFYFNYLNLYFIKEYSEKKNGTLFNYRIVLGTGV